MQDYQERVVFERTELAEKIEKLAAFISSDAIETLPVSEDEQRRLYRQYRYMGLYLDVLDERIGEFKE